MPVEVDVDRLLPLFLLSQRVVEARRHHHLRPQTVAAVQEDEACRWFRAAAPAGDEARRRAERIERGHDTGPEQGALQEIASVRHGYSVSSLR